MDFNTTHQEDLCIWYKQENLSIAITTREKKLITKHNNGKTHKGIQWTNYRSRPD